jgi:hypothetical protein
VFVLSRRDTAPPGGQQGRRVSARSPGAQWPGCAPGDAVGAERGVVGEAGVSRAGPDIKEPALSVRLAASARFKPEVSKKHAETHELHREGQWQIEKGQGWTWKVPSTALQVAIPVTPGLTENANQSLPR